MTVTTQFFRPRRFGILLGLAAFGLSACENLPDAFKSTSTEPDTETATLAGGTLTLEERDVEAPDVFNVIDDALWDGRPSFGGVWVAYPGNTQPERVNIRNVANGKSVVGALFKREADNPGPKITISSDAAEELGVLAGTPTKLTITALRREPIEVRTPGETAPAPEVLAETVLAPVGGTSGPAPQGSELQSTEAVALTVEEALAEVQASETATVQAPEAKPEATVAVVAAPAPAPAPTATQPTGTQPSKPFIQVGTFSSDANARDLVLKLNDADVPATIRSSTSSSGKKLFRVVAGPAANSEQLTLFSSKIKDLGFKDAFPISQ